MTQSHETIHNIHAQVLDSCIRENHLVQKIPLYFPLQAQPEPVSVACDITFINESKVLWHAVLCYMRPICGTGLRRHPVLVVGVED